MFARSASLFALNVTCFFFGRSLVAARLNAVHNPYVVFRESCLMLAIGFLFAFLRLCTLLIVVRHTSVVSALALAVRSSSAVVMLSYRNDRLVVPAVVTFVCGVWAVSICDPGSTLCCVISMIWCMFVRWILLYQVAALIRFYLGHGRLIVI